MHRFVGVIIIHIPEHVLRRVSEHPVEVCNDFLLSAHESYHTLDIMGNEPSLLERIAFHASVPLLQPSFLRPWQPVAFLILRAEPSLLLVKNITIGLSLAIIQRGILILAEHLRKPSCTPVGVSILERVGQTQIARGITQTAVAGVLGGVLRIFICLTDVVVSDSLSPCVSENRDGRIAQHASGV